MICTILRTNKSTDGAFGNLVADLVPYRCVTEENLKLIIPAGTYPILFMWSNNFQQIMPHVIVPGRSAIEIHWANYPVQLAGCIALGTEADFKEDMIDESKDAWVGFVKAITDQPSLMIKLVDDYGISI